MKDDILSSHLRYSSLTCSKRLQRKLKWRPLPFFPLVLRHCWEGMHGAFWADANIGFCISLQFSKVVLKSRLMQGGWILQINPTPSHPISLNFPKILITAYLSLVVTMKVFSYILMKRAQGWYAVYDFSQCDNSIRAKLLWAITLHTCMNFMWKCRICILPNF